MKFSLTRVDNFIDIGFSTELKLSSTEAIAEDVLSIFKFRITEEEFNSRFEKDKDIETRKGQIYKTFLQNITGKIIKPIYLMITMEEVNEDKKTFEIAVFINA